jgi:hypothetical protein
MTRSEEFRVKMTGGEGLAITEEYQPLVNSPHPPTTPRVAKRTITPATTTPSPMARKALFHSIASSQLKKVAVYTPVRGRGIATNRVSPRKPYLSTFGLPLLFIFSK